MKSKMENGFARQDADPIALTLILIIIAGISWYIQYRWRRRRIYELFGKMKQAPGHPLIGHVLKLTGTPTEIFDKLVEDFFDYGPNFGAWFANVPVAVIGKPEDLETCMQSQCCVQKSYFYKFTKDIVGEGLFSAPVHKWRRNRKIIQPTFNSKILNNFVPIFASAGSICVNEILPKYVNRTDVDWYVLFTATNVDIIAQTTMGVNTDAQRRDVPIGKCLNRCLRAMLLRMLNIFFQFDIIFSFLKISREMHESVEVIKNFTYEVLAEKKKQFKKDIENEENEALIDDVPLKRKVFLELLLEQDRRGNKFTDEQLKDEIMTFFVGGTDTSAVTTSFFLLMMGMHQEIQQKVYEEVVTVLGPERSADVDDFIKLDLLERCLKETMRLFSPAPFISREVTDKEVVLSDCVLPVGTVVVFPIFYTHRCADYWKDPLKFNPDRFLPEEVAKRHPYTFLPFSGGLRGCIGMPYSYMNLKNLLGTIVRRYKIHCDYYKSIEDIKLKNCIVIRPKDGFNFYLEERT